MSTTFSAAAELAVTGVGVVSPWGDSPEAVGARTASPGPDGWFDHRRRLGPRGYKYLPAAAQYALASARAALADGGRPDAVPADRRGLLLATNAGLGGVFSAMDATVTAEGAGGLSPALAPYFAVNVLGNRLAAELSLNGFALTVGTARTAALDALSTGALALGSGRGEALLLTAAEEILPGARGGEQGAVTFALEPVSVALERGAVVRAVVRAGSVFVPPGALSLAGGRERAERVLVDVLGRVVGWSASASPSALVGFPPAPPVPLSLSGAGGPCGGSSALAAAGVRLDLDSSGVSDAVVGALGVLGVRAEGGISPRRVGCLGPAFDLADAVASVGGGERRLVVCATGAGQVAFALVSAVLEPHTQELQHAEIA